MPGKMGLYVPKRASRKGKGASRKEPLEVEEVASIAVQTDGLSPTQPT